MKAFACAALLLLSPAVLAQSGRQDPQQGPPQTDPRYQQGNGPQDDPRYQQGNGPQDDPRYQQGNGPQDDPRYQQGNGPQDYGDRQPPPGDRNASPNGRNPGSGDRSAMPDRFAGWVLATTDANWQTKWETPSNTTPSFTIARDIARGKKVFVLIFFANPKLDSASQANVTCDIQLIRPDGSVSTHQTDAVCFNGPLQGDPHETFLAMPVTGFVGDPGDQAGAWKVDVVLRDNNRHTTLPVKTSFVLKDR